jgi:small subunit ribosomal protein S17
MADEEKNETTEETPEAQAAPAPEADEAVVEEAPEAQADPSAETTAEGEAETATADAEAVAEPAVAPTQSEPKKKHKRLPRSQRPKKTRVPRVLSAGRKPLTREPKPEHDRGRRQERRGVVVSDAMDKTIVVKVDTIRSHPRYKKVIRRSIKFHAHDEQNQAHVGDVVRIVETRPLSATKRWRLVEVVEVAK